VVIVTDENVERLGDCVAALSTERRTTEIVAVVVGTLGLTRESVDRVAASSWRLRRLDRPGGARGDAFREGASATNAELLVLCDAGDPLDGRALAGLVADMVDRPELDLAGATGATLGRRGLGDLVLRRSLWERAGLDVDDSPFADWCAGAELVLAADRATEGSPLRAGQRRGTGEAFGSMPRRAPWIEDWWRAVRVLLESPALRDDRDALLSWLLDTELPTYLRDAERCTRGQWETLQHAARTLMDEAPTEVVAEVGVEQRVRAWLAANGHRAALETFNVERWLEEDRYPTAVANGRVLAHLPVPAGLVPEAVLELGHGETPLAAELISLRWLASGRLALDLVAVVRRVRACESPSVRVWLVDATGRHGLDVTAGDPEDREPNQLVGEQYVDHSGEVYTATVTDPGVLPRLSEGSWFEVEVELEVSGVVRRGRATPARAAGVPVVGAAPDASGVVLRTTADEVAVARIVAAPADVAHDAVRVRVVEIDGGTLVLRGTADDSLLAGSHRLELRGPATSPPAPVVLDGNDFEARVPLLHDAWGLGTGPLPVGGYRVRLVGAAGKDARVTFEPAGDDRASLGWQRSETFRLRAHPAGDGALALTLRPPLRDLEVGPFAQQGLRRWYTDETFALDPDAVYLQSYTGAVATDSPRAIHDVLRRARPDLSLYWGVADRATALPDGAVPVVMRSREWYEKLATCRYLVTNVEMERWFEKRPGQRLLQTFHGYPAKTMGIASWEGKNFTPRRVEQLLRRTSRTWDLLLTPHPSMDVHYREQYRYEGEILATGYPRDDDLLSEEAAAVRADTRRRLGIEDGQCAVLFAPTWRDDLATNFRVADVSTVLDVEGASRQLGDQYVFLSRGHRFHRRRDRRVGCVVDVTTYPEVNHLILASDVAVLDYSSLRFDFALTGRPMIFLVPDLDRYVRGFLYDFRQSAPGPLVETTAEVVALLRDVAGLASSHREAIERFNATFNSHQDGHASERAVQRFFGHPTERSGRD
jgi:CDP-glycerol glycerophosphotransferase (TagB/SpsB family)